jgi:ABC-2 type transport system permease protein
MNLRLLAAFIRRDFRIAASYPAQFPMVALGGVFSLTLFYFLAKVVGQPPALRKYGHDYFSFALMGIAVATCLRATQTSFARRLREAQVDGSLEVLLAAPLPTFQVIGCLAAFPICSALLRSIALVLLGLPFGARLSVNPAAFGVTLILALFAFGALGLISAAFVLTFQKADPFAFALDMASYLLCGVIYPVEVLPPLLRSVSRLLPATYALEALRAAGLENAPIQQLLPAWAALGAFAIGLWPAASAAVSWARKRAERVGTLPQS